MIALLLSAILFSIPIAGVMSAIKTKANNKRKAEIEAELCEIYGMSEARLEAEIDTIIATHPSLKLWYLDENKTSAVREFLDEMKGDSV